MTGKFFTQFLPGLLLYPLALIHAAEPPPSSTHGALAPVLQPFVDRQVIGGIVALVADKDRVLDVTTVGVASLNAMSPMRSDTMFWLASITKTFTATALMMLVDEGRVNVDDAVEKYLPEFRGQQVIDAKDKTRTHPPQHPMTIKELLAHTSGIIGPNDPPVRRTDVLKEDARQYGAAPMKWEPGTKYEYNNSGINTAGRIIEVVSGMPYGDFIKRRLLDPLGMSDTTFWPDDTQAARLAMTSQFNREKSVLEDLPNKADSAWLNQPPDVPHVPVPVRTYLGDALRAYPNYYAWPAGGLFSTAPDLVKFGQMMLSHGVSNGKRLVSEAAFKRMTTVAPGGIPMNPQPSIGLGWFVKLRDDDGPSAGSFGHNGARGPEMWVDPTHQLVMLLMIESMDIHQRGDAQKRLRTACFKAAIEKYGKPSAVDAPSAKPAASPAPPAKPLPITAPSSSTANDLDPGSAAARVAKPALLEADKNHDGRIDLSEHLLLDVQAQRDGENDFKAGDPAREAVVEFIEAPAEFRPSGAPGKAGF